MSQIRAHGTAAVTALLRQMADDLDAQPARLAGVGVAAPSDVAAVADVTLDEPPAAIVVDVRIAVIPEHHEPLPVEQELTHPGG